VFYPKPGLNTIILAVCLCGCQTWSLALRGENKLTVLEKSVLRKTYEPRREQVIENLGTLYTIMRNFIICTFQKNIIRDIRSRWKR
jgi:hypothetical protein